MYFRVVLGDADHNTPGATIVKKPFSFFLHIPRSFIADGTATIHPSTHLQSSDVSSHGLTIKKMRSVERRKNEKISIIEILYWNL